MRYTTALNASKKGNDTNYRFEIFYVRAVIVTSQSIKITLLVWYYFWREEIRSDTFWTDLVYRFIHFDQPRSTKLAKREFYAHVAALT